MSIKILLKRVYAGSQKLRVSENKEDHKESWQLSGREDIGKKIQITKKYGVNNFNLLI